MAKLGRSLGRFFSKLATMRNFICFLCLFVVMSFVACSSGDDPVIVSVGSTKLYLSEIRTMAPEWDAWGDKDRLAFLEHWIDQEIIYQEAKDNGILEDTVLAQQIESMTRKITVDYFLQSFTDSMLVTDAEKLDFYKAHPEYFVRGKTVASGAILYFAEWKNGDTYYRTHKNVVFDSVPTSHYLVKKIVMFDSVDVTPDSCALPTLQDVAVGHISPLRVCGGALKIAMITSREDSASVLPFEKVGVDVETRAWLEHQQVVLDRLKKEWKSSRPIFMKTNVFSKKEK